MSGAGNVREDVPGTWCCTDWHLKNTIFSVRGERVMGLNTYLCGVL